jgi:hypothetical protein
MAGASEERVCPVCGALTRNLKSHTYDHHTERRKQHTCTDCDYSTTNVANLKRHRGRKHGQASESKGKRAAKRKDRDVSGDGDGRRAEKRNQREGTPEDRPAKRAPRNEVDDESLSAGGVTGLGIPRQNQHNLGEVSEDDGERVPKRKERDGTPLTRPTTPEASLSAGEGQPVLKKKREKRRLRSGEVRRLLIPLPNAPHKPQGRQQQGNVRPGLQTRKTRWQISKTCQMTRPCTGAAQVRMSSVTRSRYWGFPLVEQPHCAHIL